MTVTMADGAWLDMSPRPGEPSRTLHDFHEGFERAGVHVRVGGGSPELQRQARARLAPQRAGSPRRRLHAAPEEAAWEDRRSADDIFGGMKPHGRWPHAVPEDLSPRCYAPGPRPARLASPARGPGLAAPRRAAMEYRVPAWGPRTW